MSNTSGHRSPSKLSGKIEEIQGSIETNVGKIIGNRDLKIKGEVKTAHGNEQVRAAAAEKATPQHDAAAANKATPYDAVSDKKHSSDHAGDKPLLY